jgi:hypothetical protein
MLAIITFIGNWELGIGNSRNMFLSREFIITPLVAYFSILEDLLKVVYGDFNYIFTYLNPPFVKGKNNKIQFSPLYKGRVRELTRVGF